MDMSIDKPNEQFSRIERMIGADGLARLQACHVAVIGLGAVGSYAVEALARAGIGRLRLVDFDQVRPSNINRQLYALHSTLGQAKAQIARLRVGDINPACRVESMSLFVHRDTLDPVLAGPPDLVIDAIDSLAPKIELLTALVSRGIPIVSAMGAALRTDPAGVRVGPLSEIHHCPLAGKVRKKLRTRSIATDFPCVYSIEPVDLLPSSARGHDETAEEDFPQRGRKRSVLGSLPTLTGIFGLTAANTALRLLLKDLFPTQGKHPDRSDQTSQHTPSS
jgi:tRNA threonylcarbamoyladenosine dehydratase